MTDFAAARRTMVDSQIRPNDVTRRDLLTVLGSVARENFVPEQRQGEAYLDRPVALKPGRALSAPSPFARLVQLADPRSSDRVLLIAAGTGYGAAVLAPLCGTLVAVESDADLAAIARDRLAGLPNVALVDGPLPAGAAGKGPFDLIVIDGAVEAAPEELFAQIAERGRLVVVEGHGPAGVARHYVRDGAVVSGRTVFNASMPPLSAFARTPAFAF